MNSHISYLALLLIVPFFQCSLSDNQAWVVNLLTELSVALKDGVPAIGIPNLDPLSISKHFYVNSSLLNGTISVDGELSGFSNYAVGSARLDPDLYMEVDIAFISTQFQGTYSIDAAVYDGIVPLSGSGPITIYLSFLEAVVNGTLVGKNQMVQLEDFDLRLKAINFVQVTAEGLLKEYGLDEVLEVSLEGLINTGIKLFKTDIQNFVTEFVMTDGNLLLRGINMDSIILAFKDFSSDKAPVPVRTQLSVGNSTIEMFLKPTNQGAMRILSEQRIMKLKKMFPRFSRIDKEMS